MVENLWLERIIKSFTLMIKGPGLKIVHVSSFRHTFSILNSYHHHLGVIPLCRKIFRFAKVYNFQLNVNIDKCNEWIMHWPIWISFSDWSADTIVVLPPNTSHAIFQQRNVKQYNVIGEIFLGTVIGHWKNCEKKFILLMVNNIINNKWKRWKFWKHQQPWCE